MTPYPPLRHGNQQGSLSRRRPGRPKDPQAPLSGKTAELFRLYCEHLEARYRPASATTYRHDTLCFLTWLSKRGVALPDVRPADLLAYQSALLVMKKGRPFAAWTQHGRIGAMKSFFRFLHRRGYLLADPSQALDYPRVEHTLPRVILTLSEARRLVEATKDPRDRAILETLYGTGMRAGELIRLRPEDVDLEEGIVRIVEGKGGKDRRVPLTRPAKGAIEDYLNSGRRTGRGTLFLGRRGGSLQIPVLNRMIQACARRAGIKKPVSCHTLRHTCATHLLKGRADIRLIQALLGHGRLSTTERYTRVEISDLASVVRRAHPRGR